MYIQEKRPFKDSLFDAPGLFHVGQPEYADGNCYQYHLEMGEIPCTPRIVCDLREEFRTNAARLKMAQPRISNKKKVNEKGQTQLDRWDRELKQFAKWQTQWGFDYRG